MITLTLLLTLLLCLNTTYAADNSNNTLNTQEPSKTIEETNAYTISLEKANTKEICQENENTIQTTSKGNDAEVLSKESGNTIQANKKDNDNKQTESQNYKIIEDSTYSNYFSNSGNIIGDKIKDGDTIDIKGVITNKNFNINCQVTFTSTNNGKIINGSIKLSSSASNSIISNLYIQNSQEKGTGISLINVSNVEVRNNILKMNGTTAYGIMATHSSHLQIINNTITQNPTYSGSLHNAILFGDCHYNTISKNKIEITKISTIITTHNGIYFSTYSNTNANFDGGYCNYNNITDNIIKGVDTTMCYTIQMMGDNNLAQNNTVFGGAIGISSAGSYNQIINNNVHGTVTGIAVGSNNIVRGNKINLNKGANGISISTSNNKIQKNDITTIDRPGIYIEDGSNNIIETNTIKTSTGYGISLKGNPKNNNIVGNTINTTSTGIMFKKQSKKSYPVDNTIKNNNIKTTDQYTIDAYESDNTIFLNNDLISNKGSGEITIRKSESNSGGSSSQISGKTYTLNDESYSQYFNKDGSLKHDVVGLKDRFNINGAIYNKNMTIDIPIIINGESNAVLYNTTIKILPDGSETSITNLKIINDNQIGIITYETNNVNIENNSITVNQILESYGIYLHSSDYNKIINNTIYSYGDYVNFGIFLYASSNNKVLKNHVNTISNNNPINYQSEVMLNDDIGQIPEIFTTYGIIAVYSSDNQINENIVKLTSLFKDPQEASETCMNSMVGIDIYYDSHDNKVNNNIVTVIGNNPYSYGMGVLGTKYDSKGHTSENAEGNSFENNIITVDGSYFATGFIAGLGSTNTLIKNNTIITKSKTYTYGITLEESQESTIISNKITLNSIASYGMELYASNKNKIDNNELTITGYYKYGIAGGSSSNNEITNNKIQTINEGTKPIITNIHHSDVIGFGDTGILLIANSISNSIKLNEIRSSSDYTINLTNSKNNIVTENLLINKKNLGTKSIISGNDNKISNNGAYKLNIEMENQELSCKIGETITLTAKVNSPTGNSAGASVTFKLGLTTIGTSIVKDGVAKITYKIPNTWSKGYLDIILIASKEDYISKTLRIPSGLELLKSDNTNSDGDGTTKQDTTQSQTKTASETKTAQKVTITTTKTTTTVSKKAKKLVLKSKLQIGKKLAKSKTVTYIISGKKYPAKTNNKGVVKLTLKKSALKNILKKAKVGKKIKYQIKYGKKTVTKYITVKK